MNSPYNRNSENRETSDSWRLLRIVSEFVDGFESMTALGPSVAFFGSTHSPENPKYYEIARQLAHKVAQKGFGVITGGGPGLMEAVNRGAQEAKGKSCGLCISLPTEEQPNPYIDSHFHLSHRYFFVRKVMFVRYARAFVVLPGGYGTIDELFEALTLIQTKRIEPFPVYIVGKEYWQGLIDWMKGTLLKNGSINKDALSLFKLTDDLDEIVQGIETHFNTTKRLENF
jgi:uncharacterized protein (TIGR00730 family)